MTATIHLENHPSFSANCSAEGEVRQFLAPEGQKKLSQHLRPERNSRKIAANCRTELSHFQSLSCLVERIAARCRPAP